MHRAGFPATMEPGGTLLVTTAQAPTMAFSPILSPGKTKALAPTNAPRPISILPTINGVLGSEKS